METAPPTTATAHVKLTVSGKRVSGAYTVPTGPTPVRHLLPIARQLGETLVSLAAAEVVADGETISCKKGCGACCRQLVPISPAEAYDLRDVIEAMPETRRDEIRRRMAEARRTFERAGILEPLLDPESMKASGGWRDLGLVYFHQGVACPFLEDESCSIYADRPLACREYLVTSPAEECAKPSADTVRRVPTPGSVARGMMGFYADPAKHWVTWVPLVLAEEWANTHPEAPESRTGPQILKVFFEGLVNKKLDVPDVPGIGA